MKKQKHTDRCVCGRCLRRLIREHDKYLKAWMKEVNKRFSKIEHNTSPHVLAGHEDTWI